MPQIVRSWLVRFLPEWFLPTSVILKERNPQRADSYENEIDTYHRLQSLQGTHIPRFFGEVAVIYPPSEMRYQISQRPTPAILLENVKGVPLQDLSIEELEDRRLHEELRCVYDKLTEHGVLHGDPRLHNFLRHHERVVAIDFEFSYPLSNSDASNEEEFRTFESTVRQMRGVERLVPGVTIVGGDT